MSDDKLEAQKTGYWVNSGKIRESTWLISDHSQKAQELAALGSSGGENEGND